MGGAAPQTPRVLAGGGKASPERSPKGGRLDKMLFFSGAADDTGAADDRPPAAQVLDRRYGWRGGSGSHNLG